MKWFFAIVTLVCGAPSSVLGAELQPDGSCHAECAQVPKKSCEEVQRYRRQKSAEWNAIADCLTSGTWTAKGGAPLSCPAASSGTQFVQIKKMAQSSSCQMAATQNLLSDEEIKRYGLRQKIIEQTREMVAAVEQKKNADLDEMMKLYEKYPPQTISSQDMDEAVQRFEAHVLQAVANHGNEGYAAIKNTFKDYVAPGLKVELAEAKQKYGSFPQLLELARSSNEGRSAVTPYFARMVLLFNLEKKVKSRSELDDLAKKLNLKYHHPTRPMTWNETIPHNGYVNGAYMEDAEHMLNTQADASQSAGMDCVVLVQKALEGIGVPRSWFKKRMQGYTGSRVGSSDLANWKVEKTATGKPVFQTKFLCSEEDLEPGDIVTRGTRINDTGLIAYSHVYVFTGYQVGPDGQMEMRVTEATGNGDRAVREASQEVYLNGTDCKKSRFTHEFDAEYGHGKNNQSKAKCAVQESLRLMNLP